MGSGDHNEATSEAEMKGAIVRLQDTVNKIAMDMEKAHIAEFVQLLNHPRRLIFLNLLSGTARGVGIAIGFSFFAATIVYFLQQLGALNLPIIGDYIAELVKIVQWKLDGRNIY